VGQVEAGRDANGRRRRARIVRRTKKAVLADLDELKRRATAGAVGPDPTVAEHVAWWIDNVKAPTITESSRVTYKRRYKSWVKPYLSDVRLRKLTAQRVQEWLNALAAAGLSASARNDARTLLVGALHYAEGVGMVPKNVASFVQAPKVTRRASDALTKDETDRVLAAARGDRLEALWVLALKYGMRPSEMLALRWEHVDLAAGTLRVAEAKSAAGVRELPLLAGTLDALKAHRKRQAGERLKVGPLWTDSGHVFTTLDGRALPRRTFSTAWHALLAKAEVADRRPYAARHSAATLLLEAGVPLEVVSAILGHSGLSITADVYARVRADLKRRGLSALDS
jgi:integrase